MINEADIIWKKYQDINSKKTGYTPSVKRFEKREHAEHMLQSILDGSLKRVHQQLREMNFEDGDTVLDIGAGPGTLAVPLAKRGCNVTVVEPSGAMLECMEVYWQRECGAKTLPIKIIPRTVEELDDSIGQFDYVISSFALTVYELRETLLKMHRLAKKEVHIFWFVTAPPWGAIDDEVRRVIHPEEPIARVYSDLIWRCLYEEGIHANIRVHTQPDNYTYDSVDEAVAYIVEHVSPATAEQEEIVQKIVASKVVEENGRYRYKGVGKYAHIWWDTRENKIDDNKIHGAK